MDTNFIVSVISVSFASISPIILTVLNHRHEAKSKSEESKLAIAQFVEIELHRSKIDAFKNLFKVTGDYLSAIDTEQEQLCYGKIVSAVGESSLYCSDSSVHLLEKFNQYAEVLFTIKSPENYENFISSINALHSALRSELYTGKQI